MRVKLTFSLAQRASIRASPARRAGYRNAEICGLIVRDPVRQLDAVFRIATFQAARLIFHGNRALRAGL
jgi:hypothetical protein